MRTEFYFPSKDGNTEIHTIEWKPDGEVKAVLQISHGMLEHAQRYDEFAQFLAAHGFYVVANDHLGHGKSVQSEGYYGFFHEKYGNTYLIGDMHTLRQRCMEKYPKLPYFMLGHSMGSILVRQYIQRYGKGLAGVILSGAVSDETTATLQAGKKICQIIAACRSWHYCSKLVNNLSFGRYDKKMKSATAEMNWITSDGPKLQEYLADPLCSFAMSVNGYYHMYCGLLQAKSEIGNRMIPKTLPILLASGAEDPVGDFGKGVKKIYDQYVSVGAQDIQLQLYENGRHEILNEVNRRQVYQDMYEWLSKRIGGN